MRENAYRLALVLLLLAAMLLAVKNLRAESLITLKVPYPVCSAPCTIRTSTRIKPAKENRAWSLAWTNGDFASSHLVENLSEHSPYEFVFDIKEVPQGEYTIEACLYSPKRTCAVASAIVR